MVRKIIFITTFFIISASSVFGCRCALPQSARAAFNQAETVMIVQFNSIERWPDTTNPDFFRGLNFTVEKVYKGEVKPGDTGLYANNKRSSANPELFAFSSCDIHFGMDKVGKRMLFYGSKPKEGNEWTAYTCSGTGLTSQKAGDIAWLERMKEVEGKTRISGRVMQDAGAAENNFGVAGLKVVIRSCEKDYTLKTDANGVYEIYGLPPGSFTVRLYLPKDLEVRNYRRMSDFAPGATYSTEEMKKLKQSEADLDATAAQVLIKEARFAELYPGGHTTMDFYLKPKEKKK